MDFGPIPGPNAERTTPVGYSRDMGATRRAVVLLILLVALVSPVAAADSWVLWEKKEGQTAGEFNDTWTPIGS